MNAADLLQIFVLAALWGGSFLLLRVSVPDFGPVPLIAIRVAVAAGVLLPFLWLRGEWPEFRRNAGRLFTLGLVNAAVPFPLFALATLYVSAGLAAILNATAPLFAALLAGLWLKDRLRPSALAGLAIGFTGVFMLVGGVPRTPGIGVAVAAGLSASLMYGVAASFVKRYLASVSSWVTTTGSFGFAAVVLMPLAVWQWPAENPSLRAWTAVLLLAVVCTSIPNIFYFRLVLRAGPARAMTVAFLIPGFAMLWGALVLGEQVTWRMIIDCLVILAGTALVTVVPGWRARVMKA